MADVVLVFMVRWSIGDAVSTEFFTMLDEAIAYLDKIIADDMALPWIHDEEDRRKNPLLYSVVQFAADKTLKSNMTKPGRVSK